MFIVGLPRLGTTLIEQILAAHPRLHGAGELPALSRVATQALAEPDDQPWQAAFKLDRTKIAWSSLTSICVRYAMARPKGGCASATKSPLNFFHLAFAATLFPGARVIHCRRDSHDNALSIWMENFNPDQGYATDFDDLAFYMAQYRRLMVHWPDKARHDPPPIAYGDYLRREVLPYRWDIHLDRMWGYHTRNAGEERYRKGAFACRLCAAGSAAKRREHQWPSDHRHQQ